MALKSDEFTVGDLKALFANVPDHLKLIVYDENKEKYQDLYDMKQLIFTHESEEPMLPIARKGQYPHLDEGEEFVLLTGWSISQ